MDAMKRQDTLTMDAKRGTTTAEMLYVMWHGIGRGCVPRPLADLSDGGAVH
jgi:hypothetical protein